MPERWQSELEKVDLLEPVEDLQDRIGHVPTPDRRDAPSHRIVVGLVALAIFAAAGLFAWRIFDRGSQQTVSGNTSSEDLPQVVEVTCAADGTAATPEVVATAHGVTFRVHNPGGMDEVVVVGTTVLDVADMDLSSGNRHTFELPPDLYMVGCFTDRNKPRGSPGSIAKSAGMVPVQVNDPNGLYVSDEFTCSAGGENDTTQGYASIVGITSEEELIRHVVRGLMPSDVVERTGYAAGSGGFVTYRIVRDSVAIGRVRFIGDPDVLSYGGVRTLELQSCSEAGLSLSRP